MNKMLLVLTLATTSFLTSASNLKDNIPDSPKTKIEQFSAKTGVVMVRGFHKIGTVNGLYGTLVNVQAKEFTSVSDGRVEYGITLEAFKENGNYDKEHTSFIDYDEIDSLVEGIDYISKITPSITKLENFQADYTTKGDLKISVFNSSNKIMAAVTSGTYGGVAAYYKLEDLSKVRDMILSAKTKIDNIK